MAGELKWKYLDPAFPDDLPAAGREIYVAFVQGVDGGFSDKVYMEPKSFLPDNSTSWPEALISTAKNCHGEDAIVIWQYKPLPPQIPKRWKICMPMVCENRECDAYDDGYCMCDDDLEPGISCSQGQIRREFSGDF